MLSGRHCWIDFTSLTKFDMSTRVSLPNVTKPMRSLQVLVVAPSRLLARASVFHAFAWGVSAVVTLAGALSGAMEAEEMTGVCAAGGQSDHWLLYFVLLPETFLLLAVVALLVVIIVWAAVNGPQPDEGGAVASWASKRAIACQMSFAKKMTFCCIFLLIKVSAND